MSYNLKWLLLIPVIAVAIGLGYLLPKLLGGSGDQEPARASEENKALDVEISDAQQTINGYLDVLNRNPNDVDAAHSLADKYRELGSIQSESSKENESYISYKSAIDYYRKYMALKPNDNEVKIDMGLTYGYMQMPEIAERELKAITVAAPDNQRAWHSLGWVQANLLGKKDEAKVAWQKSISINASSAIGQESQQFINDLSQSSGGSAGTAQAATPTPGP